MCIPPLLILCYTISLSTNCVVLPKIFLEIRSQNSVSCSSMVSIFEDAISLHILKAWWTYWLNLVCLCYKWRSLPWQSIQSATEYSDEFQSLEKALYNFIPAITTEKCKYDMNEILLIKYSLFCTALNIDLDCNSLIFCKIASDIKNLGNIQVACDEE